MMIFHAILLSSAPSQPLFRMYNSPVLPCSVRGAKTQGQNSNLPKGISEVLPVSEKVKVLHPQSSFYVERLSRCLHGSLAFTLSLFHMGRYSAGCAKRNLDTDPAINSSSYNLSCLEDVLGQWWLRIQEVDTQLFGLILPTP